VTAREDAWPDGPLDAVREAAGRALAHASAYEARQSLEEAKRASGMARRLGRLEESAGALAAASLAHYYQAGLVDAVVAALDAARRGRDDAGLARAWFAVSLAFLALEARDVARACAHRSRDCAEAAADPALLARAHFALGFAANEESSHDEAITELRKACRLLRGHGDRALAMKAVGNLARVWRERGDAAAAAGRAADARRSWRHAARLFAVAARIPATSGDLLIVKGSLGAVLERLGQARHALPLVKESVGLLTPESLPWLAAEACLRSARVRLALDDLEGAATDLEAAAATCRDDRAVPARVDCHLLNAELAERLGRRDKEAVFRAYARTAKLRREEEVASARRQALALWARFGAAEAGRP
jgi:tetratricopeptide (TPR) repeat protein